MINVRDWAVRWAVHARMQMADSMNDNDETKQLADVFESLIRQIYPTSAPLYKLPEPPEAAEVS